MDELQHSKIEWHRSHDDLKHKPIRSVHVISYAWSLRITVHTLHVCAHLAPPVDHCLGQLANSLRDELNSSFVSAVVIVSSKTSWLQPARLRRGEGACSMQKNGNLRKRPRNQDDVIDVDALDEVTPVPGPSARPSPVLRQPSQSTQSIAPLLLTQATQELEAEELADPSVSIVDLFRRFNKQYFWGSLHGVFVEFSTRMTSCAGTCTFRGKLGGCRIALSEPLLKFRPRSDLLSTLLHEMIHAYLS